MPSLYAQGKRIVFRESISPDESSFIQDFVKVSLAKFVEKFSNLRNFTTYYEIQL